MAVPAHDQRDLDFARQFGLPVRVVLDTGSADPAQTGDRDPRRGHADQLRPAGRAVQAGRDRQDHRDPGRARDLGRAAVNYRLRDWLLSRQRFWGAPIPIVYCDGCGEVAGAGRAAAGAAARPARPGAGAQGPVAAGRGHRLGQYRVPEVRRPGQAGHRHHGHVRRFVLVLPAVLLAVVRARPVRGRGGAPLVPGRPVRRRRRARDPAPAVLAVLRQGAARHGHAGLHRAVHGAGEPGSGHQPGQGDVEVAGQRRRPGRAAGRARRRRDPADDDLRQPARGRHRLGRRAARRRWSSSWAGWSGSPPTWPRPGTAAAAADGRRRSSCGGSPTGPSTKSPGWSSRPG